MADPERFTVGEVAPFATVMDELVTALMVVTEIGLPRTRVFVSVTVPVAEPFGDVTGLVFVTIAVPLRLSVAEIVTCVKVPSNALNPLKFNV